MEDRSTLAKNIRYLIYKYDISIDDWDQPPSYVVHKVFKLNTDNILLLILYLLRMLSLICVRREIILLSVSITFIFSCRTEGFLKNLNAHYDCHCIIVFGC